MAKTKSFEGKLGKVRKDCLRVYIPVKVKRVLKLKAGDKVKVLIQKVK